MSVPLSDYALIGDTRTAALVSRDGSVDWLCAPRFDAAACFAALLGDADHGRFRIAPAHARPTVRRAYRPDSMVLETEFETPEGRVRVHDAMPLDPGRCELVRVVEGLEGRVPMQMEWIVRFDYGSIIPWVERDKDALRAVAGPDGLVLRMPPGVEPEPHGFRTRAAFAAEAGRRRAFVLTWFPSHRAPPAPRDPEAALEACDRTWRAWSARSRVEGPWREAVIRSLLTLKALTYAPTGGIVAAPTTSLPEQPGGVRNWDYRFCWLRDATFTLYALLISGHREEAVAWREWLLRAAAGHPADLQILYGIAGERRLPELELPWLPGWEGSRPVRVGNAASGQFQLDVFGEIMDALHLARAAGVPEEPHAWQLQRVLLDHLESRWSEPDEGLWEVRGPPRDFTHSKVMAWVAFDRAVKAVERSGLEGPVEHWRALRARIHDEVCTRGFDAARGSFVQSYGSRELDASLLLLPLVGFLPPQDPRVRGTLAAVERELCVEGLLLRYRSERTADGLPPGEGVFLPCSFWWADNLLLQGRREEAERLFDRLLALRNDVGLLSEEAEPQSGRLLGNFPQAFTHVMLVNTARNLARAGGPCEHRAQRPGGDALR